VIKRHLDLTSGRDRGRIYRIVPKDFTRRPQPRLSEANSAELVALLEHKNAWHHETAMRLLYERQDIAAAPALEKLAAESRSPEARMRALYVLSGLNALNEKLVSAALRDPHPRVREHAARLAEPFLATSPELQDRLAQLAGDDDVRVRYQVAFSLGEAHGERITGALASLAVRDAGDPLFRLAILSSSTQGAGNLFHQLSHNDAFREREDGRTFLGELARLVGALGDEPSLGAAFARLEELPDNEAAFVNGLVQQLLNGLALSGRNALARSVLANSPKSEAALRTAIEKARGNAASPDLSVPERVRAIETLSFDSYDNLKGVLVPLFDLRQPAEIQLAALSTLRKFDEPDVAEILLAAWPDFSPQMRAQAIEALFSRKAWIAALLDAIEQGQFKPSQLDSTRIRALQSHADPELQARAGTLLSSFEYGTRQAIVDAYEDALSLPGNSARGREVFRENCAQCHKLEGVGFDVGPELTTVAQAGAEKILVNVLDPNREVNPQYINYTIDTSDFESHSGIIASETATSITLKRANGETDTVLRVNIDSIRSDNLSIMPEGWEDTIDKQKMADLIAYITSVK
jgi:putative heme-binding domain-containing protein